MKKIFKAVMGFLALIFLLEAAVGTFHLGPKAVEVGQAVGREISRPVSSNEGWKTVYAKNASDLPKEQVREDSLTPLIQEKEEERKLRETAEIVKMDIPGYGRESIFSLVENAKEDNGTLVLDLNFDGEAWFCTTYYRYEMRGSFI